MASAKEALKEVTELVKNKLTQDFGFCGVAEGDRGSMLNASDADGNDIIITIKLPED